jgi:hypothetical protein
VITQWHVLKRRAFPIVILAAIDCILHTGISADAACQDNTASRHRMPTARTTVAQTAPCLDKSRFGSIQAKMTGGGLEPHSAAMLSR